MNASDLSLQQLSAELRQRANAWLNTTASLTVLMCQLAAPQRLCHHLESVGWTAVTPAMAALWSGFELGELVWQRRISFSVTDQQWLEADVLIPKSSLLGAAGIALQYCGAQSLGAVLFQDPDLQRQPLSIQYPADMQQTSNIERSGLYHFFSQPLVITECLPPVLWQQPCCLGGV